MLTFGDNSSSMDARWGSTFKNVKATPSFYGVNNRGTNLGYHNVAISSKLNSDSKIRRFLFLTRRNMIKSPMYGIIVNIMFGFLTNILLMLSIGILYESLPLNDIQQTSNNNFLDC
jgi:hypothetical protein